MIEQWISATRLRAIGYAETIPLADYQTAEGRQKHRRVTIIVSQSESIRK